MKITKPVPGNWKRFVFASDLHGDMQDKDATERFLKFVKDYGPQIIIFGGDLFDLRPLRRGASADERQETMREDYNQGSKFLTALFDRPAEQRHLLWGNHDDRLFKGAESGDGILSDLCSHGVIDIGLKTNRLGIKTKPYHKRDGILRIGHAKFLHGFFCGVYAARQHATVYNSCFFGHTHVIDESPTPGLERRVARGVGALCKLDMDYNSRNPNTLRQANGWAFGAINSRTGDFFSHQAEKIGEVWNVDIL